MLIPASKRCEMRTEVIKKAKQATLIKTYSLFKTKLQRISNVLLDKFAPQKLKVR